MILLHSINGCPLLSAINNKDAIYWVSVFVNGRKEQPKKERVYPKMKREPNGMKDRLNRYKRAIKVLNANN